MSGAALLIIALIPINVGLGALTAHLASSANRARRARERERVWARRIDEARRMKGDADA